MKLVVYNEKSSDRAMILLPAGFSIHYEKYDLESSGRKGRRGVERLSRCDVASDSMWNLISTVNKWCLNDLQGILSLRICGSTETRRVSLLKALDCRVKPLRHPMRRRRIEDPEAPL